MPPITVLYVNHVSFISGAERSLLELLAGLDREAVAPVLACPSGPLASQARDLDVEVVSLPLTTFKRTHNPLTLSSYVLAWMSGGHQFRKIVNTVAPKIIHANSAMAQVYAGPVAEKAGIPCLWHARDLRPLQYPANGICRGADHIIAISQCVAEFLGANGFPQARTSRVYNGIEATQWQARVTGRDARAGLPLDDEQPIILMAAQLAPWKRHEDAIRAMPHILTRRPETRLVLAGSDLWGDHPELEARLKTLAGDLSVRDEVIFAGQRDDIPDLIAAAEMVVIPSDAEPFGRTAIEAMALGKPVVGTRAGGLPEIVSDGKTGLLVVPRFPESLADACLKLLENPPLARRLGEAGRERAVSVFSADRMAGEIAKLYERLRAPSLKWIPA